MAKNLGVGLWENPPWMPGYQAPLDVPEPEGVVKHVVKLTEGAGYRVLTVLPASALADLGELGDLVFAKVRRLRARGKR